MVKLKKVFRILGIGYMLAYSVLVAFQVVDPNPTMNYGAIVAVYLLVDSI